VDSFGNACPPFCILTLQNVTTNVLGLRLPALEHRYNLQLWSPDGRQVGPGPPRRPSQGPTRAMYSPGVVYQIDSFRVLDVFNIHTNGKYTLIVSMWASANHLARRDTNCFLLLPVTNTFIASIPPATKTAQ